MKKRRNLNEIENVQRLNPVAKHAYRFNKTKIFDDKRHYRRQAKHSRQEVFPRILGRILRKASCLASHVQQWSDRPLPGFPMN